MIYLDANATCPLLPRARKAMVSALAHTGNPSSVHQAGVEARRLVEGARRSVADAFGVMPENIIFTSGGSEANNTILNNFRGRPVVVSAIEHESVRRHPAVTGIIPVTPEGAVCLESLEKALHEVQGRALVSVMLANNETGILQPLQEVVTIARRYGAEVHTDAAQVAGRLLVEFWNTGADWLTLGGHKAGAPGGIGAIIGRGLDTLTPLLYGGSQEKRRRAGTENVAAIVGLGAVFKGDYATPWQVLSTLRDRLEARLPPGSRIIGQNMPRLPNTSYILFPDPIPAETRVIMLDLAGICVSAGAACSSGKVTASSVLLAMGLPESDASRAVRFSLGWQTTEEDIERVIAIIKQQG